MEAFAAKVLVLASDTPEHREAVVPKQTGFLFKNNNADDLAKFLNEILQKAPYDKIKTRALISSKAILTLIVAIITILQSTNPCSAKLKFWIQDVIS